MGCITSIQVGLENVNKKPISICVLGLKNAGKTSIIEYLAGEYNINDPPIHTNGVLLRDLSVHNVLFRIYDIGGFGTTSSDVQESIENSNAAIYVFDALTFDTDFNSNQELLKNSSPLIVKKRLPVVIICNKMSDTDQTDLKHPIEDFIESYYGSEINKKYIKMGRISDQIFPVFQWIYDNIRPSE